MTDIVERLRAKMVMVFKPIGDTGAVTSSLEPEPDAKEAADEIERLRGALRMWVKFWECDNEENLLEPLLAEEAMEETRSLLEGN